mmetsp:Transcript_8357/g.13537  ORF Transcript_8357/g.13537 Transcript_8357/m.13537 type:complete len:372 (+) Transcript_8357:97-1212(+)
MAQTRYGGNKVFDSVDLTRPALESLAVFVQTNFFETRGQTQGYCTGTERKLKPPAYISEECECGDDPLGCPNAHCIAGMPTANGITTGKCVNTNQSFAEDSVIMATRRNMGWMCVLHTWCPLEDEAAQSKRQKEQNILDLVANFTLFARVDGRFPELAANYTVSNFQEGNLIWNKNLFYLSDMVAAAAMNKELEQVPVNSNNGGPKRLPQEHFEAVVRKGGEILVDVRWDCNLDQDMDNCLPKFSFDRIDEGKGFNYREAREYYDAETGTKMRDLTKRYGLRIVFRVFGTGGRFDFVQLGMVVGSGLGLLGIATVLADLILLYLTKQRVYQEAKYEDVLSESEESLNNSDTCADSNGHDEYHRIQEESMSR